MSFDTKHCVSRSNHKHPFKCCAHPKSREAEFVQQKKRNHGKSWGQKINFLSKQHRAYEAWFSMEHQQSAYPTRKRRDTFLSAALNIPGLNICCTRIQLRPVCCSVCKLLNFPPKLSWRKISQQCGVSMLGENNPLAHLQLTQP